jgi:hypothetical protein
MQSPLDYRSQATRARRLASKVTDEDVSEILKQTAKDYEEIAEDLEIAKDLEIAEDLESGIVEVPHRDLVRQLR